MPAPTVTYATVADLNQRLPDILRDQLLTEVADEPTAPDVATLVLIEAQGLIDSKLSAFGYIVPITGSAGSPDMLTLMSHTLSIGKFLMLDRRGASNYDPSAQRLYEAALEWLKNPILVGDGAVKVQQPMASSEFIKYGSEDQVYGERPGGFNPMKGL